MFHITNNLRRLTITQEFINTNPFIINSQIVRWRKPRWVPKAKSKIFKVPPRTLLPEDEKIELKRLNDNYNTQIRSIQRYLKDKHDRVSLSQTDPEELMRHFEDDYAISVALNNKWNEDQKVLREKQVEEKLETELSYARKRIEDEIIKREQKLQEIEEIVRNEKEQSRTYITSENIDAAILHALANPTDYNFAINVNGDKIVDFEDEGKKETQKVSTTQ